jgi:hypothetical protein
MMLLARPSQSVGTASRTSSIPPEPVCFRTPSNSFLEARMLETGPSWPAPRDRDDLARAVRRPRVVIVRSASPRRRRCGVLQADQKPADLLEPERLGHAGTMPGRVGRALTA